MCSFTWRSRLRLCLNCREQTSHLCGSLSLWQLWKHQSYVSTIFLYHNWAYSERAFSHLRNPNTGYIKYKLNIHSCWQRRQIIISEKKRYENVEMDDGIENTGNMLSVAIVLLIMTMAKKYCTIAGWRESCRWTAHIQYVSWKIGKLHLKTDGKEYSKMTNTYDK